MKVDRKELEIELQKIIDDIKHDQKTLLKLEKQLKPYKLKPSFLDDIILGNVQLSDLDYTHLYVITQSLFDVTEDRNILPERFFNENEIKKASNFEAEKEINRISFPIVFEPVLRLSNEDYITTIDSEKIKLLLDSNLLYYNIETQRNPKTKKRKGETIFVANVNKKSVKEIEELIKNNSFYPDTIRFNVLSNGEDNILYDAKNMKLIINSGEIDIIDGFHRVQAALAAYEKYGVNYVFELSIKNYPIRQAQKYVGQINTVNKMDKTHLRTLKEDRLSDMIVKNLQRDSELKGKIATTSRLTSGTGHLTTFSILSDAIDEMFKPTKRIEVTEISDYLAKFFDYLLGNFEEAFITDVENVKKMSLINDKNVFVGYVVLAKRFYENKIPFGNIKDVIQSINFSKGNSELAKIVEENKDNAIKMRRLIREYFEQIPLNG